MNSFAADGIYNVWAYPPEGQPYLMDHQRIVWNKAALEQSVDLTLPRGVAIRGTVTEEGSGKPVPDATVGFSPRAGGRIQQVQGILERTVLTVRSSSGRCPAPAIFASRAQPTITCFKPSAIGWFGAGQPGGRRIYAHALLALDLKPGTASQEVTVSLRRGTTVKGQVTGPDGQPVLNAYMISRIIPDPRTGMWRTAIGSGHASARRSFRDPRTRPRYRGTRVLSRSSAQARRDG